MKASSESGLCATVMVRVFGDDAVLLGIVFEMEEVRAASGKVASRQLPVVDS